MAVLLGYLPVFVGNTPAEQNTLIVKFQKFGLLATSLPFIVDTLFVLVLHPDSYCIGNSLRGEPGAGFVFGVLALIAGCILSLAARLGSCQSPKNQPPFDEK